MTEKKTTQPANTVTLTTEQINARITLIEQEIIQETNDPDRTIELRRELYTLKEQLAQKNQ